MSKLRQIRNGIAKIILQDNDVGTVTREVKVDNGRGGLVPTGDTTTHKVNCRIATGAIWHGKPWAGGVAVSSDPIVVAFHDSNLLQGDVLEWRKRKYVLGVVTKPELNGGALHTEAPLTEVK